MLDWVRKYPATALFIAWATSLVVGLIGYATGTSFSAGLAIAAMLKFGLWYFALKRRAEKINGDDDQMQGPPQRAPLITPLRGGSFGPEARRIPPSRRCPACGRLAKKTDRFCGACGRRIY